MATSDSVYEAIGRIPSGAAILTASADGRTTGTLVSWLQQAAFEPPMITVAIRKGRYIEELISVSGRFAANLLPDKPGALMAHFVRGFGPDENAFNGLETSASVAGPVLRRAAAHLLCIVRARYEAGDHHLYLAEVMDGTVTGHKSIYVHRRRSGAAY